MPSTPSINFGDWYQTMSVLWANSVTTSAGRISPFSTSRALMTHSHHSGSCSETCRRRLIDSRTDRYARDHDLGVAQPVQQRFVLLLVFRFPHLSLHLGAARVDAAQFAEGEVPAVVGRARLVQLDRDLLAGECRERGRPLQDALDMDDSHIIGRLQTGAGHGAGPAQRAFKDETCVARQFPYQSSHHALRVRCLTLCGLDRMLRPQLKILYPT
jgi:hypothetical protein